MRKEMMVEQWDQLYNMQIACISIQSSDRTTPAPYHPILSGGIQFLTPNQQFGSTEGYS